MVTEMSDNKENPLTDHDAHIFSAWYHCVSPSSNLANFSDESNIVLPESSRIDTEINEYTNMINLTEKFYNNEQFIELVVPQHEHRAAMESIITKPDQPGSKQTLFAKAQTPVQFGFQKINQKRADNFRVRITLNCGTLQVNDLITCDEHRATKKVPDALREQGFFAILNNKTNEVVSIDNQRSFDVPAADIEGSKADRLFSIFFVCFSGCLRKTHKGVTAQNINPRSELKLYIETEAYGGQTCLSKHSYSLPIRILANPGRDCPQISLRRPGKAFTCEQSDKVGQLINEALTRTDAIGQFDNETFAQFRQEMTERLHSIIEMEAQLFLGSKKRRQSEPTPHYNIHTL